jgi:hypothetical protein
MSFLHSTVTFKMGWVVAAAVLATILLVLWIATLLSRNRFVTIRKSEETELMSHFLGRIAESLDRLASASETQTRPHLEMNAPVETNEPIERNAPRPLGLSMFGR